MAVRTRRLIGALAASAGALALGACGSDDFKNDPRPPAPIELSARISDHEISVSPNSGIGAGLATITISNQSDNPARLVLEGPTDDSSDEIGPAATGDLKLPLEEGDYTVSSPDSGARDTKLEVGAERKSSQNDLLLP